MDIEKIFSDLIQAYYSFMFTLTNSHERLYWLYVIMYILLAFFIYIIAYKKISGFIGFLFPQKIYMHQSTKIDFFIFLLQPLFVTLFIAPASFIIIILISSWIVSILNIISVSPDWSPNIYAFIIYNILWILFSDFGQYIAHYWQHKNPILWEFHKIHHSAEVLNPITAYRLHPLDHCFLQSVVSMFTAIPTAFFSWLYTEEITLFLILKMHFISFLFFLAGYHFRHSHIKLTYPKWLQYILICPSQHQLHHSIEEKHWNKNMGLIFAFWDYLGGTLHLSDKEDIYQFGLSKKADKSYHSLYNVYMLPFINLFTKKNKM